MWLAGCPPGDKEDFTPLSCTEDVGDESASDDQRVGLDAANCYRAMMGLSPVSWVRWSLMTQSHADYMAGAGAISHQQTQGRPGFTGEWVWDRSPPAAH